MRIFVIRFAVSMIMISTCLAASSQVKTQRNLLRQAAIEHKEKEKLIRQHIRMIALEKGWDTILRGANGKVAVLTGIDEFGIPLYLTTENNISSAATIGTNKLWPGGLSGLNINGSGANVRGKLAIWDGGKVRNTHVELTGRVLQKDNATELNDHATHVAGTMVATGINPLAKGMSFGQQELIAYSFTNGADNGEMLSEASDLLVSNHSYGIGAGWNYNENESRWEFRGAAGENEDYKFGYYSSDAQIWDSIAYNAPYYLIVKSVGNNRDINGPPVGEPYWRYNASGVMINAGNRPAGISSNDGYDIIPSHGTSKNILTVGAVNPISSGYTRSQDVLISSFSSWGPTDDGRIKPDVVANGVNVLSTIATANNAYDVYSGTSMATPSASGSLLLLQEYYSQRNGGNFMRSATLKGLAIHTADEAGPAAGPDYQYGWGLLNIAKAADVIRLNNTNHVIDEQVLANGATYSLPVVASGNGTISATISWTDVKGSVTPAATALDNTSKKLVNDLDIVIKKGTTIYRPWTLSPTVPGAAATRGNNSIDNVEKVELADVVPGETYTIEVTHKSTLERGEQAFSLIASGVGGQAYCASAPTSTAGPRIDSVSFSTIKNKNVAGCTSYSNFTNLVATVESAQSIPLFVRVGNCDGSSGSRIVKAFIDVNNDGDFTDAGENVATSNVISGTGDFTTNVVVPAGLKTGNFSVLRIVMVATGTAASVTPCGSYAEGETQDYRLQVSTPSSDVGVVELISPSATDCPSGQQYITVKIRNFGSSSKSTVPVSVLVQEGVATIANYNASFKGTINAGSDAVFTFPTPFNAEANATYTFTATTSLVNDQNTSNNQLVESVAIRANGTAPAGTAVICGTNAMLKATPATSDVYNWYTSAVATSPVASGASASTTTIASTYYLAKNDIVKVGPANKMVFPNGGYLQFDNNDQVRLIFTTQGPVTLDKAKMYFGHPGKVQFTLRRIQDFNFTDGSYNYFPAFDVSYTVDAYATAPVPPVPGESNNSAGDAGAVFHLGIDVPMAGTWAIITNSTGGASIFRNNNISTTNYPYSLPGVISLTGNGAVDGTNVNYFKEFYYFFYDLSVKINSCASERVPIVATTTTAPVIVQNGNDLSSNITTGNQWYLNGAAIPGATGQNYTAVASGKYTVQISNGGCTVASNEISLVLTAIPNVDPSQIDLLVSPNPAPSGKFHLQLETRTRANLDISMLNSVGQRVYQSHTPGFSGRLSKDIEPGKLAPGVYYLQVIHDKKRYVKKIAVVE